MYIFLFLFYCDFVSVIFFNERERKSSDSRFMVPSSNIWSANVALDFVKYSITRTTDHGQALTVLVSAITAY